MSPRKPDTRARAGSRPSVGHHGHHTAAQSPAGERGEVRIHSGMWRSRRVQFPAVPGLRPTPDRVRETLFNWLGQDLTGFRCLDLYAGSGALGFEALSRGAECVVMVEHHPVAVRALIENAARLGAAQLEVVRGDALEFLRRKSEITAGIGGGRFDLVFLDPPFDTGMPSDALALIRHRLRQGGHVYLESGSLHDLPQGWQVDKQSRAGKVHFQLLRLETE